MDNQKHPSNGTCHLFDINGTLGIHSPNIQVCAWFHLGFLSSGGKRSNCRAKGGEDYSNTLNSFSLARNIMELIDFYKLGESGGMLPQEKF